MSAPRPAGLDDPTAYQRLDPQDMRAIIRDLPRQCRAAWQEAQAFDLPADYRDVDRVVILGMGGSAIAGDLLRALAALESPVPIFSHRGYDLPLLVDGRTLLIASSYSGNTEETLSAFQTGSERRRQEAGHHHRRPAPGRRARQRHPCLRIPLRVHAAGRPGLQPDAPPGHRRQAGDHRKTRAPTWPRPSRSWRSSCAASARTCRWRRTPPSSSPPGSTAACRWSTAPAS